MSRLTLVWDWMYFTYLRLRSTLASFSMISDSLSMILHWLYSMSTFAIVISLWRSLILFWISKISCSYFYSFLRPLITKFVSYSLRYYPFFRSAFTWDSALPIIYSKAKHYSSQWFFVAEVVDRVILSHIDYLLNLNLAMSSLRSASFSLLTLFSFTLYFR